MRFHAAVAEFFAAAWASATRSAQMAPRVQGMPLATERLARELSGGARPATPRVVMLPLAEPSLSLPKDPALMMRSVPVVVVSGSLPGVVAAIIALGAVMITDESSPGTMLTLSGKTTYGS